jgi:hypothetical protein
MTMRYRFQVCLDKGMKTERWADVHPAGKPDQPYEYETLAQAEDMARICYGNDHSIVRIHVVDPGSRWLNGIQDTIGGEIDIKRIPGK